MSEAATQIAVKPAPTGKLAWEYCKLRLPLQVCRSAAGFYIGTISEDGPCSRESLEYYPKEALAEHALANNTFTQRDEP